MRSTTIVVALAATVALGALVAGAQDKPKPTAAPAPAAQAAQAPKTAPEKPKPSPQPAPKQETAVSPVLLNPLLATAEAPAKFKVKVETTKGDFVVEVTRAWAPNGVDRFYNLVKYGYYDDTAFFRVIPGFMAQIGISGNPEVNAVWRAGAIPDDPVTQSNTRGMVTFATSGPDSRTTQFFINFGNNARLDASGFAPFGKVIQGMEVVDKINPEYRESPSQQRLGSEGNDYLHKEFPKLDYIKKATIL
jgi:peptidyl-prolyl cis-trans isomerase A (cyclophilin A)